MRAPFVPSAAWRASLDDGVLVVSAGADLIYAVEDLDPASAQRIVDGWARGSIDPDVLSDGARETLDELDAAGAVGRAVDPPPPVTVGVRVAGDGDGLLERRIAEGLEASSSVGAVSELGEPDVVLVVRTTARLVDLYEPSGPDPGPHLLLDLAYRHTISLGPLVVPGETSCLACLTGRIGSLWGDAPPPPRPAVLGSPALAAALAVRELEAFAAGDFRLANATVSYDVASHRVTSCPAYRLPWCPVCGDGAAAPSGAIDLPWARVA